MTFRNQQQGVSLLVGLIMLVMMTLIAIGVVRLSTRHTQVVNNQQLQIEAEAAANYALDMVLNSPASTWTASYGTSTGTKLFVNLGTESNDDTQANSVGVTVKNLECKRQRTIKNSELIKEKSGIKYVPTEDESCFGGGGSPITFSGPGGGGGGGADDSFCANVLYEMQAEASGTKLLNTTTTVTQGVEVRRGVDEAAACS